jgi:Zn-dependent protease with chaperone function
LAALAFSWRRFEKKTTTRTFLLVHLFCLFIAMIVPAVAAVSTRTSESDRFLHLPSYFLCLLAAFVLVHLLQRSTAQFMVILLLITYQVIYLEKNNLNWRKASMAVRQVLERIEERPAGQKVYIVNLPDEIDGAYVFRNGFKDALLMRNIDTATVVVLSRLARDQELGLPAVIQARQQDGRIFIPPTSFVDEPAGIIYWNRKNWVSL